MVSNIPSDPSTAMPPHTRGFTADETVMLVAPGNGVAGYYRPFWRPVIAGAVFVLALFVMSWYLMLGFHVGIDSNGVIVLGIGAAIWLWVTSFVAFLVGGMLAGALTGPASLVRSNLLRGAGVWSFSVPLGLLIYSAIAPSGNLLSRLDLPRDFLVQVSSTTTSGNPQTVTNNTADTAGAANFTTGYTADWTNYGNPTVAARIRFAWAAFIALGIGLIASLIGSSACSCEAKQSVANVRDGRNI